jgi:hypothetical protein
MNKLAAWVDANADRLAAEAGHDSKSYWEIRRLKSQVYSIDLRNRVASGELLRGKDLQDSFGKFGADLIQLLRQKLENEFPHRMAGLDIPGIRKLMGELMDQLLALIMAQAKKHDVTLEIERTNESKTEEKTE